MSLATSKLVVFLVIFYSVLTVFSISDLKQFIFHVHISRVDRVPIQVDIDSTSSLWYPIVVGILFNIVILLCSIWNIHTLLQEKVRLEHLGFPSFILSVLFAIRCLINITVTRNRNGLSTQTLVEKSFLAPSLSLEEEITTIILDWFIKVIGLVASLYLCYKNKKYPDPNVERRHENQLMYDFE